MIAEGLGIPSVTIAGPSFVTLAKLLAKAEGIANFAVAEYPGTFATDTPETLTAKVKKTVVDQIIKALTDKKANPAIDSGAASSVKSNAKEIVFQGTYEEVNQYFSEKGWTDQLPVVPATVEKVEEFLKYTDLPPDKVVAVLPLANLKATTWKIAVNGVMAGCRPEHLPLLIAGVEAMSDPSYSLGQTGCTWAIYPHFLVSGPISKQLGIEHDIGLVCRGPNPVLGRAFGLIMRNLAGFRPGQTWMGTWGYPSFPFLAEDEDFLSTIGWKPYHVEEGFDPNTSTVTVGGTWNWGDQLSINNMGGISKPERLLDAMAFDLIRKVRLMVSLRGGREGFGMFTVLITPPIAEFLHRGGYSRQDIVNYLFEHSKGTLAEWIEAWVKAGADSNVASLAELREHVQEGTLSNDVFDRSTEKNIPVVASPRQIKVIVCGDRTREKTTTMYASVVMPCTRKIQLPGRWEQLRKTHEGRRAS